MKINIPSQSYLRNGYKLLFDSTILLGEKQYDYYHINEKIYDEPSFVNLIESAGLTPLKISSGTSDRKAFNGYIQQAVQDMRNHSYYRFYTSPLGSFMARKAVSFMESLKLRNGDFYTPSDICFATGSTGAITTVFEYIKNAYSD